MNFTAELAMFADRQFYGVRSSRFAPALDSHGEGGRLAVSTYICVPGESCMEAVPAVTM